MAHLVLTDVNEEVFHQLQQLARSHGRTPEEQARAILSEAVQGNDVWAPVDAIYRRLSASGRTVGDSAELMREDRDR